MKKHIAMSLVGATLLGSVNPDVIKAENYNAYEQLQESQQNALFQTFEGEIRMIDTDHQTPRILVEDKDGNIINFVINERTVLIDTQGFISLENLQVGDSITSYYVTPQMTIAIYPPQLFSTIFIKNDEDAMNNLYVSRFDENMLSESGDTVLRIWDGTEIITQHNEPYTGSLENQIVIVFYQMVLQSFPAQMPTDKVIVIVSEEEQIDIVPQDRIDNIENVSVFVNGNHIETPNLYNHAYGSTMIPFRAIVEALGYDVFWGEETQGVAIDNGRIVFLIGENSFTIDRQQTIILEVEPQLINGHTYVPVSFFTQILGVDFRISNGNFSFSNK